MLDLFHNGFYSVGTFRPTGKFFPQVFHTKNKMGRGESITLQCGNFSCYKWYDKRDVHVVSTMHSPTIIKSVRKSGANRIDLDCP